MELALENLGLLSALISIPPKDHHLTWAQDNTKACTLISWAVEDVNSQCIKPFRRDAAGMWTSLKRAHQDLSSGDRLHLLQQLITTRVEFNNAEAHLQSIDRVFDKLECFIDSLNPLTPDDIFTSALLNSLPNDWVHVVTPLMQQASVDSTTVIRAIQAESTRRKSSTTMSPTLDVTVSREGSSCFPERFKSRTNALPTLTRRKKH